jgi:lipopolysaccharide/colanic/teichoic acid biosynthesis glycosyltransferase
MVFFPGRSPILQRSDVREPPVAANRGLDVILALLAVFFFAPMIALIALAIYIETGTPIFFCQARLGQRGRKFLLFKFRKFYPQDAGRSLSVTLTNDARLTRVGRLLVRTKLDELPQLWNIIKGDMSIVGPRPEISNFEDCFKGVYQQLWDYKPGLFGPNQVFFRNESNLYSACSDPHQFYRDVLFPIKARVDLAYFPNRKILSDMAWIVRGVLAVLGWSGLPRGNMNWAVHVEDWIRRNGAKDRS